MADRGRVRQVELGSAAGADLDVELQDLEAVGALAFGFVLLGRGRGSTAIRPRSGSRRRPRTRSRRSCPCRVPMMPVARPKKKAITRYSSPCADSAFDRASEADVQAGPSRLKDRPRRSEIRGRPRAGSLDMAIPRRQRARKPTADPSRRKKVWKDKHWRWVPTATATGGSRATSSATKHKPRRSHYRGPGQEAAGARPLAAAAPRPAPRPAAAPAPTRAPSGRPGDAPAQPGRVRPAPGPGRAARLDGPASARSSR